MSAVVEMHRGATISPCREYRFRLTRYWEGGPSVCWIMLNPSTADAEVDDPTIRRCIGFSRQWGYGGLVVVNLFARRCTRPVHLKDPGDPVGPDNDAYIEQAATHSSLVVAAWGAHPLAKERGCVVANNLDDVGVTLHCLGHTASGAPRHPLYVKGDTEPVGWAGP